jgi:tetratricopeptide (TPR) repeat protein
MRQAIRMGRFRGFLGVAVLCIVTAGCGGAQSRLAAHLQRGQDFFVQGNYSKANVEFRNALQIAPKDVTARLMAAKTAEKLGQPGAAVGLYQSVIDSTPDNVEARTNLGRLFIFGGVPERGLEIIKPALAAHPDDAVLLTLRAAARIALKDTAGAREDVQHALRVAPTDEDAVALRAGFYEQDGDVASAIALVSDAVRQLPATTDLREVLARLYLAGNDPDKAEVQLRALVDLRPTNTGYRYLLASFYSQTNRTDEAQRVLEEAVKALPGNDEVKLALVDFLITQRTPQEGEQVLRGLIAQNADNYNLRLGLGALLQRSNRNDEAVAVYDEVIRRTGTGPPGLTARDQLAAIALSQGRVDDARKLLADVLERNPRDNDALLIHGQIALSRHDPAVAISDFRTVLRDQPKATQAYRLLAEAHVANGELPLAVEALRSAVGTAPADTALRIELAELLASTDGPDAAVRSLEETVRSAPANVAAREALTRAYLRKRDFAAAVTSAQGLKTLRPDAPIGSYLAGLAAEGQDRPDDAQKEFEHALALRPAAFDALSALARLELARGRGSEAIALVKGASERDPKAVPPLVLLGELYVAQKNPPLAIAALTQATTLAPGWWAPYRGLAQAKLAANDVPGAITAYEAGIKAAPAEVLLVTELAGLYQKEGRVDDAIASYEAWNRHNPQSQVVANNLAMLLVTYRKDRASLDRARDLTAAFASSNDGSLLDTMGWVHFKRAEYADALPVLERAAERSPNSREIRYHLGMAELQAGRTDRARSDLETALSGSATFSGADEARIVLAGLKKG